MDSLYNTVLWSGQDQLNSEPMPSNPNTLIMAINQEYALPAACALYSVGMHSPGVVEQVYILGSDLSIETSRGLEKVAQHVGLTAEVKSSAAALDNLGELHVTDYASRDAWSRLLISELCPDVDKCLYLDADILCIGGLQKLFDTELGDKIVGAARDMFFPKIGTAKWLINGIEAEIRSNPLHNNGVSDFRSAMYFNSGVILMNCTAWREQNVTGQVLNFAQQYSDSIRFWDQDALNATLIGRCLPLDRQWNMPPLKALLSTGGTYFTDDTLPEDDLVAMEENATIVHFVTGRKPWKSNFPPSKQLSRYQNVVRKIIEMCPEL